MYFRKIQCRLPENRRDLVWHYTFRDPGPLNEPSELISERGWVGVPLCCYVFCNTSNQRLFSLDLASIHKQCNHLPCPASSHGTAISCPPLSCVGFSNPQICKKSINLFPRRLIILTFPLEWFIIPQYHKHLDMFRCRQLKTARNNRE